MKCEGYDKTFCSTSTTTGGRARYEVEQTPGAVSGMRHRVESNAQVQYHDFGKPCPADSKPGWPHAHAFAEALETTATEVSGSAGFEPAVWAKDSMASALAAANFYRRIGGGIGETYNFLGEPSKTTESLLATR